MGIEINLNKQNTIINSGVVSYNLEVVADLSSLESYLETNIGNRIFMETNLEIPVFINATAMTSSITLINYYNISEIIDNRIIQYGYYEGDYDDSRKINTSSNFYVYFIGK
ncbi:hypothetical protein [uncultured Clostridium sp.]|uniref:hypothetical protein n=1 Tax=uncultured Clostridium sp. TaxID=59620 RepID=UPI0026276640|nr:hypothetical protein [uncultured Clostridium sp.]